LRQVVVDPQKGLDYPSVLRSILNADPDVVMLGRIPDRETAGLCMEASVRGRLVLSSLRTESIAETLARLPDMGLDNLLFADAMLAIVEQRLLKILCPHCREKYHPGREEYDDLAQTFGPESFASLDIPYTDRFTLFRPRGCDACGQTGYKGRTCVSEIFIFTPQIKRMIRRKESPDAMYQTALTGGMTPLLQDGLSRVLEGFCDFRHARLSCLKEPAGFR
jgi:type II secretory ATPase GspE/PulE/Tfp pilus assembly ATPase PilB-like protein